MQITKFSDLALRMLIHIAVAEGARVSVREIAGDQSASFNHLSKIAQWLAAEGFVVASRGRGGGMTLARPAKEISVGDLLRRSEAGSSLVECMRSDGGDCPLSAACGLTPMLAEAQEAFFATLDRKTLQDVLAERPGIANLVRRLRNSNCVI